MPFNDIEEMREYKQKAEREIEMICNELSRKAEAFIEVDVRNCHIETVGLGEKYIHHCEIKIVI